MCTKFQFDLMKVSETTAIQTFALFVGPSCHSFQKEAFYVIEHGLFTPDEICGALISDCGEFENPLDQNWTIPIPGNKPPVQPWRTPIEVRQ
jgi:hypothetical protein